MKYLWLFLFILTFATASFLFFSSNHNKPAELSEPTQQIKAPLERSSTIASLPKKPATVAQTPSSPTELITPGPRTEASREKIIRKQRRPNSVQRMVSSGKLLWKEETRSSDGTKLSLTKVIRTNEFKYPLLRVKEQYVSEPGLEELKQTHQEVMVADHLLVMLQPNASPADLEALVASLGYELVPGRYKIWKVKIGSKDYTHYDRAVESLRKHSDIIKHVASDYVVPMNDQE